MQKFGIWSVLAFGLGKRWFVALFKRNSGHDVSGKCEWERVVNADR